MLHVVIMCYCRSDNTIRGEVSTPEGNMNNSASIRQLLICKHETIDGNTRERQDSSESDKEKGHEGEALAYKCTYWV